MAIGVYKHCYNNFDIIVYNNYCTFKLFRF